MIVWCLDDLRTHKTILEFDTFEAAECELKKRQAHEEGQETNYWVCSKIS